MRYAVTAEEMFTDSVVGSVNATYIRESQYYQLSPDPVQEVRTYIHASYVHVHVYELR